MMATVSAAMRPRPGGYALIPWPRSIEPRAGQAAPGMAHTVETDAQIGPEGYSLEVGERAIRIAAADERGVI